jgi:hypothetical protein
MQYLERFITVEDDWYPCYDGNKVKLNLMMFSYDKKYYIKLTAWGADDTAYEQEFEYDNYEEANSKYDSLIPVYETIPDGITKEWFIDRGFVGF